MMNQEDIFKKIGQILSELNDQYQYLAQNPQELNDLELELFLANSNFLSDHVQIIKKINSKNIQKILPEHTEIHKVVPAVEVSVSPIEEKHIEADKPMLEEELFKLDNEPSTFEFILSDRTPSDQFEFEEKPIDEIFDRPLSTEEQEIIARKQKLREKIDQEELEAPIVEEDEIGPEPFLVAENNTVHYQEEEVNEEFEEERAAEQNIPEEEVKEEEAKEAIEEENVVKEGSVQESAVVEKPFIGKQAVIVDELAEKVETVHLAKPKEHSAPVVRAEEVQEAETIVPPVAVQPVIKPATLNDILAGNKSVNNNVGSSRTEIKDLKQAISLNDKMLYIRDLFNGYNLAYAEAVDLLNKMPDFQTADHFLKNNYAVKHNWAAKQDTADQFYELLNRRFPAK